MADDLHKEDAGAGEDTADAKKRARWKAQKRRYRQGRKSKGREQTEPEDLDEDTEDVEDTDEDSEPLDEDPEYQAFQAQFEQPIESAMDLAAVLAKVHMMALGAAEEYPEYKPAADQLDAIDIKASAAAGGLVPNKRARMVARMIWPWLEQNQTLAKMAYARPELLALAGVVMFAGPALVQAFAIYKRGKVVDEQRAAAAAQAHARAADQVVELTPKREAA